MGTIEQILADLGIPLSNATVALSKFGLTPTSPFISLLQKLGVQPGVGAQGIQQALAAVSPPSPAPPPAAPPPLPPNLQPPQAVAVPPPTPTSENAKRPLGTHKQDPAPPATASPQVPQTLGDLLSAKGFGVTSRLGDVLQAYHGADGTLPQQQNDWTSRGVSLNATIGDIASSMGLGLDTSLTEWMDVFNRTSKFPTDSQGMPLPAGTFPQTPSIALPPGLQPQPFQAPAAPSLPSMGGLPPELTALMSQLQGTFAGQQAQRDSLLSALNAGIAEQQANARANQPLLDNAIANINSVLTGQAMSPGLEGLVNSAFNPVEDEGQRRLRQAAEEAAAARGMSLTDTPIGQPYLEETRRFLEQMGGQRAQMGAQLRQEDAAFSQNVRAFQEGLKQQALTNQTEVLKTLGTPEQAASVLANLGIGARNAAVNQFGIQMQGALGSADQALRAALGQAAIGQDNTRLALGAQQQGFQQQFQQQQASIQNQLAMMGALGDPFGAFSSLGSMGSNLANMPGMNMINLAGALAGGQPVNTNISAVGGGGGGSSALGSLGAGALGLSSLLNVPIGSGAALLGPAFGAGGAMTAAAPTLGSSLWGGLSSLGSLFTGL